MTLLLLRNIFTPRSQQQQQEMMMLYFICFIVLIISTMCISTIVRAKNSLHRNISLVRNNNKKATRTTGVRGVSPAFLHIFLLFTKERKL